MVLDVDGSEIDWHVGYGPPPEKFQEQLDKSLKGIETFKSLAALYAEDPKNIESVFKLARKYGDKYDQDKAIKLYKEVLALDPDGQKGITELKNEKAKVTYTEYAEFLIAQMSLFGDQKPDPASLKAFLQKYPSSPLVNTATMYLGSYYSNSPAKDEALRFFKESLAKFPSDLNLLNMYVARCIRDKDNLDEGIKAAEKIKDLTKSSPRPYYMRSLAQLYALKGDKLKADEVYGKTFMEGYVSSLPFDLISYANFWVGQNENLESVEKMTDLAVKLDSDTLYILQQAASVFCKLDKMEKALQVFGPGFVDKNKNNASFLMSYTRFWSTQDRNLDGALNAATKAVALAPNAANYDLLSGVYLKMKNYPEALKAEEKAVELGGERAGFYKTKIENIKKLMEKKEGE